MLKVLELFAGIGACSSALDRLGIEHEIVDAVEIDKYAMKSFNAIHGTNFDVQDITVWDKNIECDLIMHGSPCQDFSIAGKQAGGDIGSGTRSSLMYETIRIVGKLRPKYVIWENVKNVLSEKHKHNFENYLNTMASLGYTNFYQVLNAKDYGVPQNRERVFTVSILNSNKFNFPNMQENKNTVINPLKDQTEYSWQFEQQVYDENGIARALKAGGGSGNIPKIIQNEFNFPTTTNKCVDKIIECNPQAIHQQDLLQDENGLCRCIPAGTHGSTPHLLKTIVRKFDFPPKQELKIRLKDILENEVEEKYYLDNAQIDRIKNSTFITNQRRIQEKGYCDTLCARDWKDPKCVRIGGIFDTENSAHQAGSIYDKDGIAPTLDTMEGGWRQPSILTGAYARNFGSKGKMQDENNVCDTLQAAMGNGGGNVPILNKDFRIRKLTPKECWRLMGFTDEEFEKACYGKEIVYIEGDLKCNAKLKIVKEKQRHTDMETYVLCTTKDMSDTEIQKLTLTKNSILKELNENSLNVNIAIEMLGEQELKECATSIIKCTDYMEMQNTLIKELDRHHMAIIELGKEDKQNTEKYMKIILGENCDQVKLYIISTLIEQIIKSKIYTYIHQQANIQGNIAILEDCRNNLNIMKLSNLKMEYITQKMSNSSLYKQARKLNSCKCIG